MLIALIGFTGAGKSTLGRALAREYGFACYDSDSLIEERLGSSVAELFATEGEAVFRGYEATCIADCLRGRRMGVLVTGGGAVLHQATRALLQKHAFVVHVQAPLAVIWERLQGATDRPLLQGPDPYRALVNLYHNRSGVYDFADVTIPCDDVKRAASMTVAGWLHFMRNDCTVDSTPCL